MGFASDESCLFPRAQLDETGVAEDRAELAKVLSAGWNNGRFELCARWVRSDGGAEGSPDLIAHVRIRVTPRTDGGSYVRIVEKAIPNQDVALCTLRVWQHALTRLTRLLREAERRRDRLRQAIIFVPEIGNRAPGQSLESFVDALFPQKSNPVRFAKPDYLSSLFEMRTITVRRDWVSQRPTTDFYELYWAHLIRDTTLGQVYSWILRLLLAPGSQIPAKLRPHVYVGRVLALIVVVGLLTITITGVVGAWSAAIAAGALAFVPGLVWAALRSARNTILLDFAGDAARYLEPRPGNIMVRQEIRKAGVDLLGDLHESGRYDRIVVYGHGLGSVIAYDILCRSWIQRSRMRREDIPDDLVLSSHALIALEDELNPRTAKPAGSIDVRHLQRLQHAAWCEYRSNGFSWLVTDFVTVGSPLANASWVLNRDRRTSFEDLVRDRALPTCPPVTEEQRTPTPGRLRHAFTYTHAYPDPTNDRRTRSVRVPNHAALFALTRWTNLYFPFNGISKGDPLSGPLCETFGKWVQDVPLEHPGGGLGGFAHNRYLVSNGGSHLERLRDSPGLEFSFPLESLEPRNARPSC